MKQHQNASYRWKKKPFIEQPLVRYSVLTGILLYTVFALSSLSVDPQRIIQGLPRARQIFSGAFPPDFISRAAVIRRGFIESIQITVIATAVGILLSVPFGIMAARNVVPRPVYLLGRGIIILCRSFHPIITGIIFVKAVGLGPFAGILTLIVYSIGFVGKLFAEAVEEIDHGQVEAIQASGAGYLTVLVYAVFPQVLPRLIGLSLYQLDINLRASAIIGMVGAGGIGATLNSAFGRYDYDTAVAILLVMIILIMLTEALSSRLRRAGR